jgi:hypothetical protein
MAKNTIKLKKYLDVIDEYIAAGAITPGHLLQIDSAGKVVVHATAGGNQTPLIALEDELWGKTIDDAFASGDPVQVWTAQRGEVAYMLLKNGENVAIGDYLESAGDGTLQKHVADSTGDILTNVLVGMATEAVDMSGSSGEDPSGRIKVRIV